ncbi:helix-turn-helix transcriptional regulator [Pseudochrobactrum sp. MP213Fo]|uniref:helix-turn-helix transcriptional regulator n=1 Tax=Pseudochrobactrum sp. MP213Fo TaxID=3022250 RepID=UPI003BA1FE6B
MSILKVSIRQIKAARALLNWSQANLALKSGVSEPTIKRLESPDSGSIGGREETAAKLVSALQEAGIEFIDDKRGRGVVRLSPE